MDSSAREAPLVSSAASPSTRGLGSESGPALVPALRAWRRAYTPARVAAAIAFASLVYGLVTMRGHGVTIDEPALMYAGDRTLYWLQHFGAAGTLDFRAPDPADFQSHFSREPNVDDPFHYPVLPGLIGAITSWLFHDKLALVDVIDGHHIGLLSLNAVALYLFCVYMNRLFGLAAAIAATVALALYPSAVGHSFNNAKDWPCAAYYGVFLLALGSGVVDARFRDLLGAGVLLGVAFAAKMNAAFAVITMLLWGPPAYLLLYFRRELPVGVAAGFLLIPYIAGALFFVSWPWLYQGHLPDWWTHINDYVKWMVDYGVGARRTWSAYAPRCVLYMSPPLVLACALVYLATGWRGDRRALALYALLVLWLGLPVLRMSVPTSNFYDGNRHFIEYVPALCASAGVGAAWIGTRLRGWLRSRRSGALSRRADWLLGACGLTAFALLVWPVLEYRPVEATYFNSFIGGLGGAQRQGLFAIPPPQDWRVIGTEGDYWFSSARPALARAATYVGKGEAIGVCGPPDFLWNGNWTGEPKPRFTDDLDAAKVVVVIWREHFCSTAAHIRELERHRPTLESVYRGGGLIYEILGPSDGKKHRRRMPRSLYLRKWEKDPPG